MSVAVTLAGQGPCNARCRRLVSQDVRDTLRRVGLGSVFRPGVQDVAGRADPRDVAGALWILQRIPGGGALPGVVSGAQVGEVVVYSVTPVPGWVRIRIIDSAFAAISRAVCGEIGP
jgi:hypothetical protein